MIKKRAIIIDIDGTLSDPMHRVHYVDKKQKDWNAFNEAMDKDGLNVWCRELISLFGTANFAILLLTGRPEKYRQKTVEWLKCNCIVYDKLYMRPSERMDDVVKFKHATYLTKIEDEYDVRFCIDDNPHVAAEWGKLNLTSLFVVTHEGRVQQPTGIQ